MGVNFGCYSQTLNKSIKILLNYLVGPILFIWLLYSVIHQISNQPDLSSYVLLLKKSIQAKGVLILILVFCLMLLQWTLEAKKWQLLMKPIDEISMRTALSAIFRGISFSMSTPNRLGEFAGRILFLPNSMRLAGTSLTFIGNFAQLIVTLIFGCASLFLIDPFLLATGAQRLCLLIQDNVTHYTLHQDL